MDLMTAMAAGGASIVGDQINAAVQYYNQKKLNRQAQSDTQENMKLQKQLNLKQQYDSIKQYTGALRAAGLNPALASSNPIQAQGVGFAGGSSGEAAMPNNSLPAALEAANALSLQTAQKDNLEESTRNIAANTDKVRAETDKIKVSTKHESQEVQHVESKDKVVNTAMRSFLTEMRDSTENPFISDFLDSVLASNESFDVGSLHGFSDMFFDFSRDERERELDYIAKEVDKRVMSGRYEDNNSMEALIRQPYDERMRLYKSMALMDMQIYSLGQEASLTPKKKALMETQAANLRQQTQSIYHSDPAAMWNAGDYGSYVNRLVNEGLEQAAHGFGFGSGVAFGSRFGGSAAGALSAPKFGSGRLETIKKAKEVGMPKETYQEIVKRAESYSNGDPVRRAQMINKGVEFWRKNKSNSKYK